MTNYKSSKSLLVLVLGIAALTGCATQGGRVDHETPVSEHLSKFKNISVSVKSDIEDASGSLNTIQERIQSQLADGSAPFKVVSGQTSPGTLGLELEVTEYKRVGFFSRLVLGELMGPDHVTVKATLVDLGTRKPIGTFTGTGEANLGGVVVGDAGIYRASNAIGEEIAKYLAHNQ